ncbi:MAG: PD-(D/E)XK nuclease family protein, partial [Thermodesulfovibrionales bacterium]|nr:PD-(D/E)XK nuclease family protein [Thermodesulfovibrionales bacterium]
MELLSKALGRADTKDHSSVCIISPTRHLLDNRKRMIHEVLGPCYIPPVMMTLRQFSIHVSTTYGGTTRFPDEFIAPFISSRADSGIGYATLAAEFISEIKHQYPGVPQDEIRSVLSAAFEKEDIPDEVAKRANECLDIMDRYESSLKNAGLSDSADVIANAAGTLDELDISTLILDGFYELTPLELRLVQALVGKVDHCLVLIPISHAGDDLSYCFSGELAKGFDVTPELIDIKDNSENPPAFTHFPAKGLEDEVESIARDIKANYLNSRNRELEDTWIVFPKLAPYRSMVERVLTRYGIPHCFSSGQSLADRPAYRDLISMLEAVMGNYPRVAFSRMLHSPYFRNVPSELKARVPSVSLSTGLIRGANAWRRAFKAHGLLKEINTVLKALEPIKSLSDSSSFSSFVNVLLDVLARLGFEPSDQGIAETEDALGTLAMLDQIFGDGAGDKAGPGEFIEAVKRALGARCPSSDSLGVRVAELFEVRGLEPRMLYLGGLKDGDLPARPEMDFILPERVRSRLGLVDMSRFMHLQGHIFRRLSTSASGLFMSYPQMEGDKLFLPSIYLSGGTEKDLPVKGIYCEEELQTCRATAPEPPKPKPKEVSSIAFAKEGTSIRVTDIDSYRSCPRRHFIEKVLGLTPTEVQQYEIDARELGIIAHRVMEG